MSNKSKIYLPMAIIAAAALAIPAAAQVQVPFMGVFNGQDAVNTSVVPATITTTGVGTGTHLGQFSMTQVTLLTSQTGGSGSGHFTAANGDRLDSTFDASADFSTAPLGYVTVTETHNITGGTGRFSGAQGNFILQRTHIVATITQDGDTHVTFGTFHGSITSPGGAR